MVEEIRAAGGEAVTDVHSVVDAGELIVGTVLEAFGSIDILVNNADLVDGTFHKMDMATFDAVLDVHLRRAAALTMAAYRRMRDQGYGRLVFTTSTSGLLGNFGQANYAAAKAGLYGLMRALAIEGGPKGVTANCIAPIAQTRMTEATIPEDLGKVLRPELVAAVVAYLCSEENAVNGEVLSAGGGRVARFFMGLTPGWASSVLSAEDVAAHIAEIVDETGYLVPRSVGDEIDYLESHLPFSDQGQALDRSRDSDRASKALIGARRPGLGPR